MIYDWVGETILGSSSPRVVSEVGFLIREHNDAREETFDETGLESEHTSTEQEEHEDVGQIDAVMIHPKQDPMHWCALEIQAVYFSGQAMSQEYESIRDTPNGVIPFPTRSRRLDYRSSGPNRLMPQLQIKVPSLRGWGKKMAVVIDIGFFNALDKMEEVSEISNSDIAWFVVGYKEEAGGIKLVRDKVHFTTLERAVEGQTAGRPVSLPVFEDRIRSKLQSASKRRSRPQT